MGEPTRYPPKPGVGGVSLDWGYVGEQVPGTYEGVQCGNHAQNGYPWCLKRLIQCLAPSNVGLLRLGLVLVIWLALWSGPGLGAASADGPIRVGLYIQYADGSSFTQCVELDRLEATGLDVLRAADLDLVFETGGSLGTAICKIEGTGCDYPAQDCFCQCPGNPCSYWTYWYIEEGAWRASPLGASARSVGDGDVEAWVWGDGQVPPSILPLAEEICPALATTTPLAAKKEEGDAMPSPTRTPEAPTPTQAAARSEAEAETPAPPRQRPLPVETDTPTPSPSTPAATSPAFLWLVAGMSGVAIALLGLAYFLTSKR